MPRSCSRVDAERAMKTFNGDIRRDFETDFFGMPVTLHDFNMM
jgi:hypothetical protein